MADANFADVECLLDFAGTNGSTNIIDLSPQTKTITVGGNAAISTAYSQFGTGSCLDLDGTGDYIQYPTRLNLTSKWTIECGFRPEDSAAGAGAIVASGSTFYVIYSGGLMYVNIEGSNIIAIAHGLTDNAWQHVAVSFDGTTYRYFVDGVVKQAVAASPIGRELTTMDIGGRTSAGDFYVDGQIDNYRHSDFCRYTGAFTPPSAAHDDNNGTISGNITETLAITNWRVTATRVSDGKGNGSTTTGEGGASYTVRCVYDEPSVLTWAPTINYTWSAAKVVALNDYCVPVNPDATQRLFKATDIGSSPHQTHATTEPTWPSSGTVVDNDITWTYVADLVDPISLGPKIPS